MKVWIAIEDSGDYGSRILDVFDSKEKAIEAILATLYEMGVDDKKIVQEDEDDAVFFEFEGEESVSWQVAEYEVL